jgi:hypothetical protein
MAVAYVRCVNEVSDQSVPTYSIHFAPCYSVIHSLFLTLGYAPSPSLLLPIGPGFVLTEPLPV